jgi:hypothetical protein
MTSQLSWQPPPVTRCGNCPLAEIHDYEAWCSIAVYETGKFREWDVYEENKDGITPTCPAWQQQDKEKL